MSPLSPSQVAEAVYVINDMMGNVVAAEPYVGDSAYGPIYAAPHDVVCGINIDRKLVQTASGDERISEMTILAKAVDEAYFAPESRITFNSRISFVLESSLKTFRGSVVYVEALCG